MGGSKGMVQKQGPVTYVIPAKAGIQNYTKHQQRSKDECLLRNKGMVTPIRYPL
jgi:hypothetical protein